jgi:hypothetical protein
MSWTLTNIMIKLNEYYFEDCLLIDLNVNYHLESISITLEGNSKLKNKLVTIFIEFQKLVEIKIESSEALIEDLKRSYDKDGNDLKSNEIYNINILNENKVITFSLKTDFLNMILIAKEYKISEIN